MWCSSTFAWCVSRDKSEFKVNESHLNLHLLPKCSIFLHSPWAVCVLCDVCSEPLGVINALINHLSLVREQASSAAVREMKTSQLREKNQIIRSASREMIWEVHALTFNYSFAHKADGWEMKELRIARHVSELVKHPFISKVPQWDIKIALNLCTKKTIHQKYFIFDFLP